jgi:hypothetical protein
MHLASPQLQVANHASVPFFSLGTQNEQIHFGQCIVISTGVALDE